MGVRGDGVGVLDAPTESELVGEYEVEGVNDGVPPDEGVNEGLLLGSFIPPLQNHMN
jgi:hypothetical protein